MRSVAIIIISICGSTQIFSQNFRLIGTTLEGANGYGGIVAVDPNNKEYVPVHEVVPNDNGTNPRAGLIIASDGDLYGVNYAGGKGGCGTIYKIKKNGTGFEVIYTFDWISGKKPSSSLMQASSGELFGTTLEGGYYNSGVLFKIKPDGTGFKVLIDFKLTNGANPVNGVIEGSDGLIYGMTTYGIPNNVQFGVSQGSIYRIKKDGTDYQKLYDFDGYNGSMPEGTLCEGLDGKLYGVTPYGGNKPFGISPNGVLFRINKNGSGFKRLYDFRDSEKNPSKNIVQAPDGKLYGTTSGLSGGLGLIYQIDTTGTNFTVLMNFTAATGIRPNGNLVINNDGWLAGMTPAGGAQGKGTVFKIRRDGSDFTLLHTFAGNDGANAVSNNVAQDADGNYYGTTQDGARSNAGVIFKLSSSNTYSKLMDYYQEPFNFNSGIMKTSSGKLFVKGDAGGEFGGGGICRINADGTGYTKILDFDNAIVGNYSTGKLFEANDGMLYGTTQFGGAYGSGTLFRINQDGTSFQKLRDFNGNDGGSPAGALTQLTSGEIMGTTTMGGTNFFGTIFKVSPDGANYAVLHNFNETQDGSNAAEITKGRDGNFYGTCKYGGASGSGTIYKVDSQGESFVKVFDFSAGDSGTNPETGLTEVLDGIFVGATRYGASGQGAIFKFNASDQTVTKISAITLYQAWAGEGLLTHGPDGFIYGTSRFDGFGSLGTIFKTAFDGSGYSTAYTFNYESGSGPSSSNLAVIPYTQQTINSFPLIPDKTMGDDPFQLTATSSSSLPVLFISSKPILSITGNIATITGAGKVTITASQPGSLAFGSAPVLSQTICIRPRQPSVTMNANTLTSNNTSGNQWYRDGVLIPGATTPSLNVTQTGGYTVTVTVDGCSSALSEAKQLTIVGDLHNLDTSLVVYPNPAGELLFISVADLAENGEVTVSIFDLMGRPIHHARMSDSERSVSLSSFAPGMYFIRVSQAGKVYQGTFVKR